MILTDRAVKMKDDSVYLTFIGSGFVEEGRRAGRRWVVDTSKGTANVAELVGTTGSAPPMTGPPASARS